MKWRGVLFLRFLLSLVDESEKIRHLADFLFGNILKGRTFCYYISSTSPMACHMQLLMDFHVYDSQGTSSCIQ